MAHYSTLSKVVIDVAPADHDRELAFWQAATGRTFERSERFPEYHWGGALGSGEFELLMQRLGDGRSSVHLDIHTDNLEAEVARLEALGAERVLQAHSWWIMRDPAGLVFCVIPEKPGHLTDENAQHWV